MRWVLILWRLCYIFCKNWTQRVALPFLILIRSMFSWHIRIRIIMTNKISLTQNLLYKYCKFVNPVYFDWNQFVCIWAFVCWHRPWWAVRFLFALKSGPIIERIGASAWMRGAQNSLANSSCWRDYMVLFVCWCVGPAISGEASADWIRWGSSAKNWHVTLAREGLCDVMHRASAESAHNFASRRQLPYLSELRR